MNKTVSVVIIVLVGIWLTLAGVWWYNSQEESTETPTQTTQKENENSTEQEIVAEYTVAEVAEHDTNTDCWTYIDESVYDVTAYLPTHPGGVEILRACGADGTSLFTQRTTGDGEPVGSGSSHSQNASTILEQFFVGNLVN